MLQKSTQWCKKQAAPGQWPVNEELWKKAEQVWNFDFDQAVSCLWMGLMYFDQSLMKQQEKFPEMFFLNFRLFLERFLFSILTTL